MDSGKSNMDKSDFVSLHSWYLCEMLVECKDFEIVFNSNAGNDDVRYVTFIQGY